MKCGKCGNDFAIQLAANVKTRGAKVLTAMTTTVTVMCDKCGSVFQVPIMSKSVLSVKKDKE
jgi:RNase P subunit RPR2